MSIFNAPDFPTCVPKRKRLLWALLAIVAAMLCVPLIQWITGGKFISNDPREGDPVWQTLKLAFNFPLPYAFVIPYIGFFVGWFLYFFLSIKIANTKIKCHFWLFVTLLILFLSFNVVGCVILLQPMSIS